MRLVFVNLGDFKTAFLISALLKCEVHARNQGTLYLKTEN